jgi:hypothetical protein
MLTVSGSKCLRDELNASADSALDHGLCRQDRLKEAIAGVLRGQALNRKCFNFILQASDAVKVCKL